MKYYLMIFFLFSGCTSYQLENPDVEKFEYGKVSAKDTQIKVFYKDSSGDGSLGFYLYIELKDKKGRLIDSKPSKFSIQNIQGEAIPFKLHRSVRGKYYISPENVSSEEIVLSIKKAIFKVKLKTLSSKAIYSASKFILRKSMPYRAIFQLITVAPLPSMPEIITEGGNGVIEGLSKVNATTWEFALIYPEQDQIIYILARSGGVPLSGRYRFQHVELK